MAVVREDGCYSSFCPLSCVSWLIETQKDVFFLVLGSISCAYFVHRPRPLLLLNQPQLATVILEEEDITLGIKEEKLIPLIEEVIENYSPKLIFLLGSCFIEIQKIDLNYLAYFLEKHFNIKFVPVSLSGFDIAYSCGEDALLTSLLDLCPFPDQRKKEVVIIGAVSSESRETIAKELKDLGVPLAGFIPSDDIKGLPCVGEDTLVCSLHPYLIATLNKAAHTRKSKILSSLFPIGIDGTKDFLKEICGYFNIPPDKVDEKAYNYEKALEIEKRYLKDKKIFFIGDNMFELPLARFLTDCGAKIVEVGTPYIHSLYHKKEFSYLEKFNIRIVEMPNNEQQIERIKKLNPDLIVSPLAYSYPLESMGFEVVWSVKFYQTNTSIYGFDRALFLTRMFSEPFKRKR